MAATFAACLVLLAVATDAAQAAPTLPAGFEQVQVNSGFSQPTDFALTPDGRMFVTEKSGRVRVVRPGQTQPDAGSVLNISGHVNSESDRGLLGITVDADYATNHYVYLLYTYEHNALDAQGEKVSKLTRVQIDANNNVTNPSNPETTIVGKSTLTSCPAPDGNFDNDVDCIPSEYVWHSIGTVKSDPADGTLWLGSGDAQMSLNFSAKTLQAQSDETYRGKVLHVDRNGNGLPGHSFCPNVTDLSKPCTKIYAKGFRNPFRFTLRTGGKGPIVGDVGADDKEELDLIQQGANYGWPCYEGTIRNRVHESSQTCVNLYAQGTSAVKPPLWDYQHTGGNAIAAGPKYTGSTYPSSYANDIFVADFAAGWIKRLELDSTGEQLQVVQNFATFPAGEAAPVDLEQTPQGDLAYLDIGYTANEAGLYRFRYTPQNASPVARATGSPLSGAAPLTVSFDARMSTDADGDALTYTWDFGDGTTGSGATPTHTYSTVGGNYTARVTVTDGRGGSSTASVGPITPGNTAPNVTITAPATFRYGQSITVSGSATDAQDGNEPGSRMAWTILQQHGTHTHAFTAGTGSSWTFNPGTDHDADSFFKVTLTVTDANGASTSKTVEIRPQTVNLTLDSNVKGLPLGYSTNTPAAAPFTVTAAIGFDATVIAPATYLNAGRTYNFLSWSDLGARQHVYRIPAADTTLTANYNAWPTASATQSSQSADVPADISFDARGSSDPDGDALTYAWNFGDGGTSNSGAPTHRYGATGTFTPTVTVTDGRGGSATKTLGTITITDAAPTPSVTAPALYRAGETITVTGSATDRKDGAIPPGGLAWKVIRNTSSGSPTQAATGTGGSIAFTPPNSNDTSTTYDFELTATDSANNTAKSSKRVSPRTTAVNVASSPTGAAVSWGGTTTFPKTSIAGFQADATAPATFVKTGDTYAFKRWSDGNTNRTRAYKVPDSGATLTAEYDLVPPDTPPTATIDAPADGSLFDAGEQIGLRGAVSDAQSTATATWAVERHRGGTVANVPVSSNAFTVPADASVDDWYRVILTARDSAGQTTTDAARLDPHTSSVRLESDPAGVQLGWNGTSVTPPASALAVVGNAGTVSAPVSFDRDGRRWLFGSWSDGGAREHSITVAAGDPLLTARFGLEPLPDPVVPSQQEPEPAQPGQPQPEPQPPGPQPQPQPRRALDLSLPRRGLRLSRKGLVSFKLKNPDASVWRGDVVLATSGKVRVAGAKSRKVTFARGTIVVAGGAKRVLQLQVSRASQKLVAKLRRVRVTVSLTRRGENAPVSGVTVLLPPRR